MSESEWNQSHPAQCTAYVEAWEKKQSREEIRLAILQLRIFESQGVKMGNGMRPKLDDFLPEYIRKKTKKTPEQREAELKAKLMAMAKRKKS